jgi:hypothetical protein
VELGSRALNVLDSAGHVAHVDETTLLKRDIDEGSCGSSTAR